MQNERRFTVGNARMRRKTEKLLNANCQDRPFLSAIIDGNERSGRNFEMGRGVSVESLLKGPRQKGMKRVAHIGRCKVTNVRFTDEIRRKPFLHGRRKRVVGYVRPFVSFGTTQSHDPLSPLRGGFRPGQSCQPSGRQSLGEYLRCMLVRRYGKGTFRNRQGAVTADRPCP